jgi:hypothetical protein
MEIPIATGRRFEMPWTTRQPKAFFNTMDWWAYAPLGPFLCPTTEEKKWPIAPKPLGPVLSK